MNELIWIMLGTAVIVIISAAVAYCLTRIYSTQSNTHKNIYLGRLEDNEVPIENAMKELKLRNSIADVSLVPKKKEEM